MLKAGFARLDVTPPLGTSITGYFYPRISDGILDPIYLNAIALSDGENTILVIAADFMSAMENTFTDLHIFSERAEDKCLGILKHVAP